MPNYENLDEYKAYLDSLPFAPESCGSCRSLHGTRSCRIPDAPLYVLSNDKFMSRWGGSKGRINCCVVPCADMNEARAIEVYIEKRSDQNRIRITDTKPQPRGRLLSLLLDWRENALQKEGIA